MKSKKGQSAVEVALFLPFLLFLMCGILDFGRILYTANTLNMVSQEAVRYSGLGYSNDDVINFAKAKAAVPDADTLIVTITPSTELSGKYVTLNIKYNINYITPLMNKILPNPYEINTQSTIRVE